MIALIGGYRALILNVTECWFAERFGLFNRSARFVAAFGGFKNALGAEFNRAVDPALSMLRDNAVAVNELVRPHAVALRNGLSAGSRAYFRHGRAAAARHPEICAVVGHAVRTAAD